MKRVESELLLKICSIIAHLSEKLTSKFSRAARQDKKTIGGWGRK